MRRFVPVFVLLLVLAAIPSACATAGGSSGGSGPGDVITSEQLAEYSDMTALEVIRRLHPTWLRPRRVSGMQGPEPTRTDRSGRGTPAVIQDGVRIADDSEYLSRVSVSQLSEIRYRDAREATTLYGTGYPLGVIELVMAR